MLEKLKSRKLLLTLIAVLGHVCLALSGQANWQEAINASSLVIAAYVATQGYVDGKKSGV
jgi:hypothetical protein